MRCLERNKRLFYYAQPSSSLTPILDDDENETGEYTVTFGTKTAMRANISAVTGSVAREWYGIAEKYDRVICFEGECPFDETAGLWIDNLSTDSPDYGIRAISESLNSTSVLVKKLV